MKNYYIIYDYFSGAKRVVAKRVRTFEEMCAIVDNFFPGCDFYQVDGLLYERLHVGDRW